MLQNLRGDGMDLEDEMRDIAQQLKQTHMDMEQEAEPAGGPKATRYGREIEKLEKDYKKKKTEFKKVMAKIERLEMF
jgi:thiamine kinase-like enzyme